jgi:hypothetical protein
LLPSHSTSKPRLDVRRPVRALRFALIVRPSSERFRHLVTPISHAIGDGNWRKFQAFDNCAGPGRLRTGSGELWKNLSSKIKGRGTCARLRFCLHISFGGTHLHRPRAVALITPLWGSLFCVLIAPGRALQGWM